MREVQWLGGGGIRSIEQLEFQVCRVDGIWRFFVDHTSLDVVSLLTVAFLPVELRPQQLLADFYALHRRRDTFAKRSAIDNITPWHRLKHDSWCRIFGCHAAKVVRIALWARLWLLLLLLLKLLVCVD